MNVTGRLLVLVSILCFSIIGCGSGETVDYECDDKPLINISACQLYSSFSSDEASATEQFTDNCIQASGDIIEVSKQEYGDYIVYYLSIGEFVATGEFENEELVCIKASIRCKEPHSFSKRTEITVVGKCSGYSSQVNMVADYVEINGSRIYTK